MNDDLRFDPVDDELRRRFDAGAPAGRDPDVVLDALRPRLQRARTRRRAAISGAIAGVAVVVVALAFGNGGGGRSVHTPPATRGPVKTLPTVTTTAPGGPPTPGTGPSTGGSATVATTLPGNGATPDTAPATVPTTVATGADTTYDSAGGSIVVRLANGQVSLVSSSAAPGYTGTVHDNGPTRVEVRFSNGTTEWRIRVDVVNGQLVPEITRH